MMAKDVKRASLVVSPDTAALLRNEADGVGAPSVAELLRLATAEQGTIGSAYLDGLAREVDQRRRKVAKRKVVVPALMSVDASGSAAAPAAESTAPRPSSGAAPARSTTPAPAAPAAGSTAPRPSPGAAPARSTAAVPAAGSSPGAAPANKPASSGAAPGVAAASSSGAAPANKAAGSGPRA